MTYRQRHWRGLGVGYGFDRGELFQVRLGFDVCLPHQHADIHIQVFGLMLDLMWYGEALGDAE